MEVVSHDFLGLEPHVSAAGFGARSVLGRPCPTGKRVKRKIAL